MEKPYKSGRLAFHHGMIDPRTWSGRLWGIHNNQDILASNPNQATFSSTYCVGSISMFCDSDLQSTSFVGFQ